MPTPELTPEEQMADKLLQVRCFAGTHTEVLVVLHATDLRVLSGLYAHIADYSLAVVNTRLHRQSQRGLKVGRALFSNAASLQGSPSYREQLFSSTCIALHSW
jgi:hypothetical protein